MKKEMLFNFMKCFQGSNWLEMYENKTHYFTTNGYCLCLVPKELFEEKVSLRENSNPPNINNITSISQNYKTINLIGFVKQIVPDMIPSPYGEIECPFCDGTTDAYGEDGERYECKNCSNGKIESKKKTDRLMPDWNKVFKIGKSFFLYSTLKNIIDGFTELKFIGTVRLSTSNKNKVASILTEENIEILFMPVSERNTYVDISI